MSAFAGLLRLNGESVSSITVQAMLDTLRHRVDDAGWEGRNIYVEGPLGLGSAVLDSTPTSRFEREHPELALVRTLKDGGRLSLVGDVRLDTRGVLETCLDLGEECQQWSDGRLVLEAYAQRGEEAVGNLKGDFAFAIWNSTKQQLFCVRDRFGVRPFYFAFVPGRVFAFANEPKALWAALPFGPRPDEANIIRYLASDFSSHSGTFYEGVERLPPAHTLTLSLSSDARPIQESYFALDGRFEAVIASDSETATQLRAAFEESVRERARSRGRLAAFLSGGLDSSSVVASAVRGAPSKTPLLALSMVFERFKECDERFWIEKNLQRGGGALESEWVRGDDVGALNEVERIVWHLDGPPPGPNTCSTWTQYAPLQKAGVHVVLDGHGGDEVVFLGYGRIQELVNQRRFKDARRELLLLKRNGLTDASATPLLWAHISQRARGTRFIGRFARAFTGYLNARAARKEKEAPPTAVAQTRSVVHELLRDDKRALMPTRTPLPEKTVREEHISVLTGALQPLALEAMDALAGAHAVEVRVPFWEEKMVTLCLSLPSDQKMRDGWNRWIMRRAMDGLLPPEVQWRRAKTNFAPQMISGLRTIEKARVEEQLRNPGRLGEWLDVERARAAWNELQNLPLDSTRAAHIAFSLWRFMALGAWLRGLPPS